MSTRTYPVPRPVIASAGRACIADDHATQAAIRAAVDGRVRGFHLPVLASCRWQRGSDWASTVLQREQSSRERRAETLLAAIGYDPESYVYQGVLDPDLPDHELIMSVARQENADSPLERWDGVDWGTAEVGPEGVEYVTLDADVLVDLLDAINSGSSGLMLRPFEPRAWLQNAQPMSYPVLAAAPPPEHTGCMVALPVDPEVAGQLNGLTGDSGTSPEDMHVTLAYLGDTEEEPIDYQAVQRATAKWARRVSPMQGETSGSAVFQGGEEPYSVALVDVPDLPGARELLVRLLEAEGVDVKKDHGFTPHITLAPDDQPRDVGNIPLNWDRAQVHYAGDVTPYELGQPAVAAAGTGGDIYYAITDEFDTNAVLDLIRILPGPIAYRRVNGQWTKDSQMLLRLMGVDPPPVTEVRPEQTEDVLAQVDAYDKAHPEPAKNKSITAAITWTESLHPRQHGKFAKKDGGQEQQQQGQNPRGPSRNAPGAEHARRVGIAKRISDAPWLALKLGNDKDHTDLDMGLGAEFWKKQPKGFRDWLIPWMNAHKGDQGDAWKKSVPNHFHSALSDFTDAAEMKGKHGKQGEIEYGPHGKMSQNGPGDDKLGNHGNNSHQVKNKQQLRDHVHSGGSGGGSGNNNGGGSGGGSGDGGRGSDRQKRIHNADRRDHEWEINFAKEGLGEARRREIFDRQQRAKAKRLKKTKLPHPKIDAVLAAQIQAEKDRRVEFERRRQVAAEQERVRRLAFRGRESDVQASEDAVGMAASVSALVADVSAMPGKLKDYWLHGEGAAKIRWGAGGDFGRCTRALAKYLNPGQIKGACANLHHLALGFYPGPSHPH